MTPEEGDALIRDVRVLMGRPVEEATPQTRFGSGSTLDEGVGKVIEEHGRFIDEISQFLARGGSPMETAEQTAIAQLVRSRSGPVIRDMVAEELMQGGNEIHKAVVMMDREKLHQLLYTDAVDNRANLDQHAADNGLVEAKNSRGMTPLDIAIYGRALAEAMVMKGQNVFLGIWQGH